MKQWHKRIRGAVGIAVIWAVAWAPVGVLIGAFVDPTGAMDEPWWAVGAYPGFVGGLVFATVLRIAARRHRFDELSLPRFAAWGAAAGLVVGTLPFALGTPTTAIPLWQLASIVIGPMTLLSSVSAAGSLALARRGQAKEQLEGSVDTPMLERGHSCFGCVEGRFRRAVSESVRASRASRLAYARAQLQAVQCCTPFGAEPAIDFFLIWQKAGNGRLLATASDARYFASR